MAKAYFTLTASDDSISKNFGVVLDGYTPSENKTGTITTTIDGQLDVAVGNIYVRHSYLVKVRQAETRDGYGTLDDLRYFYRLNKPNAEPSNIIGLVDHFEESHLVIMNGEFTPKPLSVLMEGEDSYWLVPCIFNFLPE